MIIIGAKGFAKELFDVLDSLTETDNLVFFDNVSKDLPEFFLGKFVILRNIGSAEHYLKTIDNRFALGLGNPKLREKLTNVFESIGGKLTSVISPHAKIGTYTKIGEGSTILPNAVISSGSEIGKGCLVYFNSMVTHDCFVGDFVEISPGATILGGVTFGNLSHIGSQAVILPKLTIGNNVIVGAGSVVTKNVIDNQVVLGVPARKIES